MAYCECHPQGEARREKRLLNYISNPKKTEIEIDGEKIKLVSGINTLPEIAIDEFNITRDAFDKQNASRLAFHAIQSFHYNELQDGEIDLLKAHQIGVKLAQQMFGDRFEVVVSTHKPSKKTPCVHNHFMINGISFQDGKVYSNSFNDIWNMRKISDMICIENDLSIIQGNKHDGYHIAETKAQERGQPTYRSLAHNDANFAIKKANTFEEFILILEQQGYTVKITNKNITLIPNSSDGTKRKGVRLAKGYENDFSNERIKERIYTEALDEREFDSEYKRINELQNANTRYKKTKPQGYINLSTSRSLRGLQISYIKKLYALGVFPQHRPQRSHPKHYTAMIAHANKIHLITKYLSVNKYADMNDLIKHIKRTEKTKQQIQEALQPLIYKIHILEKMSEMMTEEMKQELKEAKKEMAILHGEKMKNKEELKDLKAIKKELEKIDALEEFKTKKQELQATAEEKNIVRENERRK